MRSAGWVNFRVTSLAVDETVYRTKRLRHFLFTQSEKNQKVRVNSR